MIKCNAIRSVYLYSVVNDFLINTRQGSKCESVAQITVGNLPLYIYVFTGEWREKKDVNQVEETEGVTSASSIKSSSMEYEREKRSF